MGNGWVKIHRRILDWEWYDDANTFRLFLHLLLNANHKENRWRGIPILRGQMFTGRLQLAMALKISERGIRTSLNHLKATNEVTIKRHTQGSVITVLRYDSYQSTDQQGDQAPTKHRPSTDQAPTTNKKDKNEKKDKNVKKEYSEAFLSFWSSTNMKGVKRMAFNAFEERLKSNSLEDMKLAWEHLSSIDKKDAEHQFWPDISTFLNSGFDGCLDRAKQYKQNGRYSNNEHIVF